MKYSQQHNKELQEIYSKRYKIVKKCSVNGPSIEECLKYEANLHSELILLYNYINQLEQIIESKQNTKQRLTNCKE